MAESTIDRDYFLSVAEENRALVPKEFFAELDRAEEAYARGRQIPLTLTRGAKRQKGLGTQLRDVVLAELHILCCTADVKYDEVRRSGQVLSKVGLGSMAGYISASLGIALGVATAAVAFAMLMIIRIGINTFCRITRDGPSRKIS